MVQSLCIQNQGIHQLPLFPAAPRNLGCVIANPSSLRGRIIVFIFIRFWKLDFSRCGERCALG
jgi:hypothetical protein